MLRCHLSAQGKPGPGPLALATPTRHSRCEAGTGRGAPPCKRSASIAPSRSATSRTAATTATTPTSPPAVEIGEGEEIALETRDALDGQITPATTVADFATLNAGAVHPLTGPVFVKGAQPGDMLEIEFTDIIPQPTAFSAIMPGLGFLRDVMTEPFLVHWQIKDNWATSAQLPGVRIPGAPFMGVSAVAPAAEQLAAWTAREQRVIDARRLRAAARCQLARCRRARAA